MSRKGAKALKKLFAGCSLSFYRARFKMTIDDYARIGLITSMPEQGMSLCLVWQWHARAGSSPDQAYGAQPAREANVNVGVIVR